MIALVLAGTSFVGRHLLQRLHGIDLVATSRTARPGFFPCELHDAAAVAALLASVRPSHVFACAGATARQTSDELTRLHVHATATLLDAVRRHVPHAVVVLFGSAAEYGPVPPERLPIRADEPPRPTSPYGVSKWQQTQLAERLAREHGLRVHVVRPFNLLGPGLGPHYFAASLCQRLRTLPPGPVPIVNGTATRDWLDVRDAADAVARLAFDAPPRPGELGLYNLATGVETSVLALADHLCRLAGDYRAVDAGHADSRSAIDRSAGDATRLRAATGWTPRIAWQDSLAALWHDSLSLT